MNFVSPFISGAHYLKGSEILVHSLLDRAENDMAMGTSSLHCLKLDPVVRSRAANHLIPTSKMKVRAMRYLSQYRSYVLSFTRTFFTSFLSLRVVL
jgi:hypothetical protein